MEVLTHTNDTSDIDPSFLSVDPVDYKDNIKPPSV